MKSLLLIVLVALPFALSSEQVTKEEKVPCRTITTINVPFSSEAWSKRQVRQVDIGPFWANRGKKDPKYLHNRLYVEQPHWVFIRKDNEPFGNYFDPFFTTRGKKDGRSLLKVLLRRRKAINGYI